MTPTLTIQLQYILSKPFVPIFKSVSSTYIPSVLFIANIYLLTQLSEYNNSRKCYRFLIKFLSKTT